MTIRACSLVRTMVTPGTVMVDTSKYPSSPSLSWALARRDCSLVGSRWP